MWFSIILIPLINSNLPSTDHPESLAANVKMSGIEVIINRSIAPQHLDDAYPDLMPFYLYGTTLQQHIDHMLLIDPNAQLSATKVTFNLDKDLSSLVDGSILNELIAIANTTREVAMQPLE